MKESFHAVKRCEEERRFLDHTLRRLYLCRWLLKLLARGHSALDASRCLRQGVGRYQTSISGVAAQSKLLPG